MAYDWNYRISTTLADITKGALKARGIPSPDLPIYKDYSERVDLNDGGQALRGFTFVEWHWDELLLPQANDLVALVEDVYLTREELRDALLANDIEKAKQMLPTVEEANRECRKCYQPSGSTSLHP